MNDKDLSFSLAQILGYDKALDLGLDLRGWLRDGLVVLNSEIQGKGLFTQKKINKNDMVIRWGGRLLPTLVRESGGAKDHTAVAVAEEVVIAALPDQTVTPDDYMNHHCDSNLWMGDALTLIAKREIQAGEEITADYALWMDNPDYVMRRPCQCKAVDCRIKITGHDWKLKSLQNKYQGHFSPFIQRRISKLEF